MRIDVIAIWRRLTVLIRAPVVAFVLLNIGSTLGALPIVGNTKLGTNFTWALPVTLALMWLFWLYATGSGYLPCGDARLSLDDAGCDGLADRSLEFAPRATELHSS